MELTRKNRFVADGHVRWSAAREEKIRAANAQDYAAAKAKGVAGSFLDRLSLDAPRIEGSVNLLGAKLDDLVLKDYHEEISPESPLLHRVPIVPQLFR